MDWCDDDDRRVSYEGAPLNSLPKLRSWFLYIISSTDRLFVDYSDSDMIEFLKDNSHELIDDFLDPDVNLRSTFVLHVKEKQLYPSVIEMNVKDYESVEVRFMIELFKSFLCVVSRAMAVPACDPARLDRYVKLFLTKTYNVDKTQHGKMKENKKKNFTHQSYLDVMEQNQLLVEN